MAQVVTEEDLRLSPNGFAGSVLHLPLYDWQARAVLPIQTFIRTGERQSVAVSAPNGSGKDERIIPTAVYYFLTNFPTGRVIVTSKSAMQLETQTIPNLEKHYKRFGWAEPVKSPRFQLQTHKNGSVTAFVTNEGARIEGAHSYPESPLMIIVNEAKFVAMNLWEGLDRCTPDIIYLISSPGLRSGRFFDAFNKLRPKFTCINAGLADCPHITQHHIDDVITKWGKNHPVTRSTLYGEFMSVEEGQQFVVTIEEVERCVNNPPQFVPGFQYGFFDFAAGRAENVFYRRNGNKFWMEDAWRDVNEDAVVGRALYLLGRSGLKQHQVGGDAAAKSILDKMGQSGWAINRQNFGHRDPKSIYQSWMAQIWIEGAKAIRNREVILPDDDTLKVQLTDRKQLFTPFGKLGVEDKWVMAKTRGVESPDRADAFLACLAAAPLQMEDFNSVFTRFEELQNRFNTNRRSDLSRIAGL